MKPWVPSPAPHKPGVHTSVSWASERQRREDLKTIPAVYQVWGQHELPETLSQKKKISKKYRLCWQVKIIWNSTGKLISPFFHTWSVSVPCHEVDRRALRNLLAYTFNDSRPRQKKLADLCSECCLHLRCSVLLLFLSFCKLFCLFLRHWLTLLPGWPRTSYMGFELYMILLP